MKGFNNLNFWYSSDIFVSNFIRYTTRKSVCAIPHQIFASLHREPLSETLQVEVCTAHANQAKQQVRGDNLAQAACGKCLPTRADRWNWQIFFGDKARGVSLTPQGMPEKLQRLKKSGCDAHFWPGICFPSTPLLFHLFQRESNLRNGCRLFRGLYLFAARERERAPCSVYHWSGHCKSQQVGETRKFHSCMTWQSSRRAKWITGCSEG